MASSKNADSSIPWIPVAVGLVLVIGLAAAWKLLPVAEWAGALTERAAGIGIAGYVAFIVVYVVLACVGIPVTPLNIGAGVVFPFPIALGLVVVSSSTTNLLTFQTSRHLASDWVRRKVSRVPNAERLLEAVQEECFKLVFLVRMNPFIPAVIKGYGFGTTGIPLGTYMLASLLGSLPLSAAHVYMGWAGGAAMLRQDSGPDDLQLALLAGGVVLSVLLVAGSTVYARNAIERASPAEPSP